MGLTTSATTTARGPSKVASVCGTRKLIDGTKDAICTVFVLLLVSDAGADACWC